MNKTEKVKQTFSRNLIYYMEKNNVTQQDIADITGVTQQSVSYWVSGKLMPRIGAIEAMAKYFNILKSDLLEDKDETIPGITNIYKIEKIKFPLLGNIACGEPIFVDEDRESYVMAGTDIQADFCLKCKGDSMINARINDGDIVFIRKQAMVNNGEIAAVIIDNEATLKRFYYYKGANLVVLKAENPKVPDFEFQGEQLNQIRVIGKAVAFQSDVI